MNSSRTRVLTISIQRLFLFLVLPCLSVSVALVSFTTIAQFGWWTRSLVGMGAITYLLSVFALAFSYLRTERERWQNILRKRHAPYPHRRIINITSDILRALAGFTISFLLVGHELATSAFPPVYLGWPIEIISLTIWAGSLGLGLAFESIATYVLFRQKWLKQRAGWMIVQGAVMIMAFPLLHLLDTRKYPLWMQIGFGSLFIIVGLYSYAQATSATHKAIAHDDA